MQNKKKAKRLLLIVQVFCALLCIAFISLAFGAGESVGGRLLAIILALVCLLPIVLPFLLRKKDNTQTSSVENKTVGEDSAIGFESIPVRGASYYQGAIEKHMEDNPDWFKSYEELKAEKKNWKIIYQYQLTQTPAQLVPEPTNPHDKNAIMVCIGNDKVGYVAAEECTHVLSLIRSKKIVHATATLKGGPAKRVFDDGKEATDTSDFSVYLDLRLK